MNTKFKIERRTVLTISILMMALWLPLTTLAQDLTATENPAQSMNSRATECAQCTNINDPQELRECRESREMLAFWEISDPRVHIERSGFSEEDPAKQLKYQDVGVYLQTATSQKHHTYVGFAETDPAKLQPPKSRTFLPSPDHESHHIYAGFSETTPATETNQVVGKSPHQAFVDCLSGKVGGMVLESLEISCLTEKEKSNEHC